MHIRRAILKDLRDQLKAANFFTGVWIQRVAPIRISYPSITIHAESEEIDYFGIHPLPRKQDRKLQVAINAWVRGTADDEKAEKDLDAAALIIEETIKQPELANGCMLVAIDFQIAENDPEVHIVTLTYHITYFSTEFAPIA